MFYAYTSNELKGVTSSWSLIEDLKNIYPYLKFRKFYKEEEAWFFANTNYVNHPLDSLKMYGSRLFKNHYVTVTYYVTDDVLYYNIDISRIGRLRLYSDSRHVSILNGAKVIKVKITGIHSCNDSIFSHAIAIYRILSLIGPYIDIELILPDHSIYYMLNSYTGKNNNIKHVQHLIKTRLAGVSYTVKEW